MAKEKREYLKLMPGGKFIQPKDGSSIRYMIGVDPAVGIDSGVISEYKDGKCVKITRVKRDGKRATKR